jgi:hypothetical protein
MTDAQASGAELVAVARERARKGGFFPTPGELVEAIRERRVENLRREREQDWRAQGERATIPVSERLSSGAHPPDGWAAGRDQSVVCAYVQDLVERGHGGEATGEGYVKAMLREERDAAEAKARGEQYTRPRYGPSLVAGGTIGRHIRAAFTAREQK